MSAPRRKLEHIYLGHEVARALETLHERGSYREAEKLHAEVLAALSRHRPQGFRLFLETARLDGSSD